MSECPEGRFEFPNNGSCTDKNLPEYINKTLCDKFVDKTKINSCNQLEEFFKNGKCAQKYVPTTSCEILISFFLSFEHLLSLA